MEELFPLLFIIFVWSLIGSSIRKVLKGAKTSSPRQKRALLPVRKRSRLQDPVPVSGIPHPVLPVPAAAEEG